MDNDVAVQGGCKGLANIGPGESSGCCESDFEQILLDVAGDSVSGIFIPLHQKENNN